MRTPQGGSNYWNADFGIKSWLLTLDHKRIALLYLASITLFFFLGGFFAVLIRLEFLTPPGDLVQAETYNKLFTLHGLIMIFFFLVPSIPAVLGNFLIPLIGARGLAFPRLNLLSWYIFTAGGLITIGVAVGGGFDTGWTFYTPYSSAYANTHVVLTAVGVFITGFSSILTGLNFLVTIHKMRAPGLTWFRLPLFVWALYGTSIINVLATPVLAITILLVFLERALGVGIFDPALGGDPLLFQHLFWFYSHPVVYIMVLPSMGVVSEVITCFARKRIFGYEFIAGSSIAIAVLGFFVWGHHMFVSGQSAFAGTVFAALSFLVAVPSAIKVFNWTATLYRGSIEYHSSMLYALGFIGLFTIGGLTGLMLASLALDIHVHDTYFIVAHFHYIMVGGAVIGYLGGIHFWWPKISGRLYPEGGRVFPRFWSSWVPEKALVLCVDEKSQIQALNRTQPLLPLRPGLPARMTHDYKRNGTTSLFVALEVASGQVLGRCFPHHTHQEFLQFLATINLKHRCREIHLICDNYGTHKHPAVRAWLAAHPRFKVHYTPTSASWLNLVERWFALITDQAIRRGSFDSVCTLERAIMRYLARWNENAKPFRWTKSARQIKRQIRRVMDIYETGH